MNFLEKLNYLMSRDSLNKSTLSKISGIPYTTIDGFYKKGYEGIKLTTLEKLASAFDTTLDYLVRDNIDDPYYGKTQGFKFNYYEQEHIKKYRSLDDHGKEAVNSILSIEITRMEDEKAKRIALEKLKKDLSDADSFEAAEEIAPYSRLIQLAFLPASAGTGQFLDSDDFEMVEVGREVPLSASFGVRISGDSMEPDFPNGYIAWVKRMSAIDEGQIGVFTLNGDGYIKRLGANKLISINLDYKPIILKEYDELRTFGLVVGVSENIY